MVGYYQLFSSTVLVLRKQYKEEKCECRGYLSENLHELHFSNDSPCQNKKFQALPEILLIFIMADRAFILTFFLFSPLSFKESSKLQFLSFWFISFRRRRKFWCKSSPERFPFFYLLLKHHVITLYVSSLITETPKRVYPPNLILAWCVGLSQLQV